MLIICILLRSRKYFSHILLPLFIKRLDFKSSKSTAYRNTSLHGVTNWKTSIWIFTTVKGSNFARILIASFHYTEITEMAGQPMQVARRRKQIDPLERFSVKKKT
jgi:hypothetical protein